MKKTILLLLIIIFSMTFISACSKEPGRNISSFALERASLKKAANPEYKNYFKNDYPENYKKFHEKTKNFELEVASKYLKANIQKDNLVISSPTLFMCLSMAAQCASIEAREEILNAFGYDYDTFINCIPIYLNEYNSYRSNGKALVLSNSIWLDKKVNPNDQCLDVLANQFNTYSYQVDYNDISKTKKLMNTFIDKATNGLLNPNLLIDKDTLFTLMSVLYLKDIWNPYGEKLKVFDTDTFTNLNNVQVMKEFFTNGYRQGKYYETDSYKVVYTSAERTRITFIIPNDGYTVDDLIEQEVLLDYPNFDYVIVDDEVKEIYYTRAIFPEFEANCDDDLAPVLSSEFKIKKIFQNYAFTNLSSDNTFASGVHQTSKIKVDRNGIEGASVVYIPAPGAVGPDEYKEVYFDVFVNKAFMFNVSFYSGLYEYNLFSGYINNLK